MPTDFQQKQQTYRNMTIGRVEKPKRHVSPAERDFRWYDMKMKREAAEMAHRKEMLLQEEQRKMMEEKKRRQQFRASSDRWTRERRMAIKDSRPQYTTPPPPPYVPEKSPYSDEFYANQTPEERKKFIHERLTNILGEERMNAPILPSGHNPIDPVIADHNQRVATASIIDSFEAQRAELQRHVDEQRCMAREKEEAYARAEVLFNHYRNIYWGRINKLAMYTGEMADGIQLLDNALANDDVWVVANTVQVLTHQIFEPIHSLLLECDNEIPLDVVGAQMLKNAWFIALLNELYEYLVSKAEGLEPQVVYMAQLIEAIAHRINNPTPLVNPLEQREQSTIDFRQDYGSTDVNPMVASMSAPDRGASIPGTVPAPEGGFSIRGRASTSGVEPDAYIPGAAFSAPPDAGISKLIAGTEAKAAGTASKIPSITVEPDESIARTNVLQYIATDNMALETEIQDMFRNNEVKSTHRRAAKECIDGLVDAANGEESILGTTDAGYYRSQIETCVTKIDALPLKIRQNKDTQALKKLCGRALRIWAVHE
jgi:hypothetical protein